MGANRDLVRDEACRVDERAATAAPGCAAFYDFTHPSQQTADAAMHLFVSHITLDLWIFGDGEQKATVGCAFAPSMFVT